MILAAETARAYADACSGARQLAVAERSLKLQSDSFALTERRVAAGRDYADVAPIKGLMRTAGDQKSAQAVDVIPVQAG